MYLLFYVKNASPGVKAFFSKKEALRWARAYNNLYKSGLYSDNWADCIVKGEIIRSYSDYYKMPRKKKKK